MNWRKLFSCLFSPMPSAFNLADTLNNGPPEVPHRHHGPGAHHLLVNHFPNHSQLHQSPRAPAAYHISMATFHELEQAVPPILDAYFFIDPCVGARGKKIRGNTDCTSAGTLGAATCCLHHTPVA